MGLADTYEHDRPLNALRVDLRLFADINRVEFHQGHALTFHIELSADTLALQLYDICNPISRGIDSPTYVLVSPLQEAEGL